MAYIDFLSPLHKRMQRDYLGRVNELPKAEAANANQLPFGDRSFDLVISINTLHNLYCYDLDKALREIERVGRRHKYVVVESYRNDEEKANLLYWQLTCEMFCAPAEWEWWFGK